MSLVPADAEAIARAARLLREGGIVAFPTETVYGLGVDARNADALHRMYAIKGRPADHPVIVHVDGLESAQAWTAEMPDGARALARAFWPGPLTLIVPRANGVLDAITGGQPSVGLRAPAHPVARALLAAFGGAIAAPSANRFGHVSPTTARHVADDLGDGVDLILDGGACEVGIESTIVAFTTDTPMLLRPGGVPVEAIADVLGQAPLARDATAPRASGTLPSHYAPRTPASLVAPDALIAELGQLEERDERVAVLAITARRPDAFESVWIGAPADPTMYARLLYANLRTLDVADADSILIEQVPQTSAWRAIDDRLTRATSGEPDDRD